MKKKTKNRLINVVLILLVVFIFFMAKDIFKYFQDRYRFEKINHKIEYVIKENDEKDAIKEVQKDFSGIVGYISIPDLNIEYPLAQTKDNSYYLRKDIYGNYSEVGTIFIDASNKKDFSDVNTVIYGHNMKENFPGGDAFGKLDHYLDPDFTNNAEKIIYILTENGKLKYKMISGYVINKDYNYRQTNPDNPKDYILKLMDLSMIDFNVSKDSIKDDDKIITLSTCVNSLDPTKRFVIQAVKID